MGSFLLIGAARAGTTYLQSLLQSHSAIEIGWEPLNLGATDKQGRDEILNSPLVRLKRSLSAHERPLPSVTGFKMLYEELNYRFLLRYHEWPKPSGAGEGREIVDELLAYGLEKAEANQLSVIDLVKTFKVIHLKRENKLAMLVSLLNARLSGVWKTAQISAIRQMPPLTLEPETCERFFLMLGEMELYFDTLFSGSAVLALTYEKLTGGLQSEAERICEFLGVDSAELSSSLFKQEQRPMHEAVANFYELKERFAASRWSSYFAA